MDKKILILIEDSQNIRELVEILEMLIKRKRLSRNLTVKILSKAQSLK